ncbi:hypothetical protein B9K06_12595 [Bacillus sp. OG2]|nr:hypothetical protein B9K06_12595 [Bacillus sp. OG2]
MMMNFGMMLTMFFWIVIIGFAIYGFVLLIMKPFEKKQDNAYTILRERFARGDINQAEYEEKKELLKK